MGAYLISGATHISEVYPRRRVRLGSAVNAASRGHLATGFALPGGIVDAASRVSLASRLRLICRRATRRRNPTRYPS